MEASTQEIVLGEIKGDIAKLDRRIYGNGSGTKGLIERQTQMEGQLGAIQTTVEKMDVRIQDAAPQTVAFKGVPILWWLIGALLAFMAVLLVVIVAQSALILGVDVASITERGAEVAIERSANSVDGGS